MKITWGTGIFIVILSFIAFMAALVGFVVVKTDVDLVRNDYYAAEIEYGQTIKAMERAQNPELLPELLLEQPASLQIRFPQVQPDSTLSMRLYRNDKVQSDRFFRFAVFPASLDCQGFDSGKWNVEFHWTVQGQAVVHTQELVLP